MLSTDQDNLCRAMLTQVDQLRAQVTTQAAALDAAAARHLDYERRITEFQITIARLAALLITHNVPLPSSSSLSLPSGWRPTPRLPPAPVSIMSASTRRY